MIFEYRFSLPVPIEKAWATLLDVYRVAPCMPGASIESGEGDEFVGRMKVRLGPVEMVYRGDLHFTYRDDVNHELAVEGSAKDTKGGGGAKAKVTVKAEPVTADSCTVSIHSDYSVSGKAAQFGRGVMEEVGEKLMGEFATRLNRLISDDAAQGVLPGADDVMPAAAVPIDAGKTTVANEDDALDIGAAAGWAVMRRVLVAVALLAVLSAIWWLAQ